MTRTCWLVSILLIGAGIDRAFGQIPGPAIGSPHSVNATAMLSEALRIPYKVVFWFDGTNWRAQPYNLARGEYTQAVDDWVHRVVFDAYGFARPGSMATVREISVAADPADSLSDRLATAIRDELDRLLRGKSPQPTRPSVAPPTDALPTGPRPTRFRPATRRVSDPGAIGFVPGAKTPSSPFPYPYVRPHP